MVQSVRLSVCPSVSHTFFTMFPSLYHHEIFMIYYQWQKWCPCKRSRSEVKVTEIKTQFSCFRTITPVWIYIWWWNDAHRCCLEEVPYCFSRSSIKFQGHTRQKIGAFDRNWVFPDCNSSLNSPMDLKRCTKLDIIKKACPMVFQERSSTKFQGHTGWKVDDLNPIWVRFTRPVAAIKSLRFALFSLGKVQCKLHWSLPTSKLVGTFQPISLQHLIESTE